MVLLSEEIMMRRLLAVITYNNVENRFYALLFSSLPEQQEKNHLLFIHLCEPLTPRPECPSFSIQHLNNLASRRYISLQDKTWLFWPEKLNGKLKEHTGR